MPTVMPMRCMEMNSLELLWKNLEMYVSFANLTQQYLMTGSLTGTSRIDVDGPYGAEMVNFNRTSARITVTQHVQLIVFCF